MERGGRRRRSRPLAGRVSGLVRVLAMTLEDWPMLHDDDMCRCARCRRQRRSVERLADASLSAALRHAQDRWEGHQAAWGIHEASTPARPKPGLVTVPEFKVAVGTPVSIETLLALKKRKERGRPFITPPGWRKNDKGLYVYSAPTLDGRPLYVGETRPTSANTTLGRIYQEIRGKGAQKSEDLKKLFELLNGRPVELIPGKGPVVAKPGDIFVQPAKIVSPSGHPIDFSTDPNQHAAELLLKGILNPILGKDTLTFEDEDEGPAPGTIEQLARFSLRALERAARHSEVSP
ncbi:hypothetical protein QNA08_00955 [Chelatococcus sp. SYSU_G07232]|uniref:GIY-YIG domain-containing protein n=1 Tax=Chelatococcus albus TaxID=3047466 RepID=A0ABT7ABS3_9HYPH|nr:hypothetical protein [Chelatococcus sp. SYSU_G07232]MDJ1156813.1 hypothetical protein [Chelatococcus sp. SYSU_G07232]